MASDPERDAEREEHDQFLAWEERYADQYGGVDPFDLDSQAGRGVVW